MRKNMGRKEERERTEEMERIEVREEKMREKI